MTPATALPTRGERPTCPTRSLASPVGAPPAGDFNVSAKDRAIPYRYATTAIVGPWRATEAEARNDAMRAALAVAKDGNLVWRVPGRIEADDNHQVPVLRQIRN
jgi:hypothetical protein